MRLFLILLLALGALAAAVWDDLGQRATVRQQAGALTAYAQAGDADTASASQGQLRCSTEERSAVNVGRAIGRIAAPRKGVGQADTPRPMILAPDIRAIAEPRS